MSSIDQPERRRVTPCPLCGRRPETRFTPFCSRGCRDRDLLNWLGDAYRVPGRPAEIDAERNSPGGVDSDA